MSGVAWSAELSEEKALQEQSEKVSFSRSIECRVRTTINQRHL
jgi:hypothetical protein